MSYPDYVVWFRGRPACPCLAEWIPWFEKVLIERGVIRESVDIAQLIGGAVASGGTHALGGAYDIWQHDDTTISVARQMGSIAWARTPAQGFDYHAHGILRGCPHNGPAAYQIAAALAGYNGLGSGGRGGSDDGPRPIPDRTWRDGIAWAKEQLEDDMADYAKQLDRIEAQNKAILERLRADAAIRSRLAALVKQGKADGRELKELSELVAKNAKED